jgi:hypothetical protein
MMRLVRPKSLRKPRETIKPRTRRNNGKSMEAIVADLNRTLPGWFGYFRSVRASQLGDIDGWIRMRLRSILRKRRGLEGRGRGRDHHRWPNRYFEKLGLFCLLDARETEIASFRNRANRWLESRMREIRTSGSEEGAEREPRSYLDSSRFRRSPEARRPFPPASPKGEAAGCRRAPRPQSSIA